MKRRFFRLSDIPGALIGGTVGSVFPFLALFVVSFLPNSVFGFIVTFLGAPIWFLLSQLTRFCPSTWSPNTLGPSNDCVFMLIPAGWILSIFFGALIGVILGRFQARLGQSSLFGRR